MAHSAHTAWLVLGLNCLAVGVGACAKAPQAPVVPKPAGSGAPVVVEAPPHVPPPPEIPGLAWLGTPPDWRREILRAEMDRLVKTAERPRPIQLATSSEVGAAIVVRDPKRIGFHPDQFLAVGASMSPAEGHPGRQAQVHAEILERYPSVTLNPDGNLDIGFRTLEPRAGASVYWGVPEPSGAFGFERFRKRAAAATSGMGRDHTARLALPALLDPKIDIVDSRNTGVGTVVWRLEIPDPERGAAQLYTGRSAFRCEPVPCAQAARYVAVPTIAGEPQVHWVRPDTAVIAWSTDVPTTGVVLAQSEGGDLVRFSTRRAGIRHEVELSKLSPSTRYRYQVLVIDAAGEVGISRSAAFETAPRPGNAEARVSFVVLSDARSGLGSGEEHVVGTNQRVLRDLLVRSLEAQPGFVLFVGDLVDGYTTEPSAFRFQLEGWLSAVAPIGAYVPIYPSMGNHEAVVEAWERGFAVGRSGVDSAESIFAEVAVNPTNGPVAEAGAPPLAETVYSFDHGAVHVAVLNSNYWWRSHPDRLDHPAVQRGQREGTLDERQLTWLDADLMAARARGAVHLVVTSHEPLFPSGGHSADGMYWDGAVPEMLEQRERLIQILAQHGVGLVFSGDEHNYSRTQILGASGNAAAAPLWQIVSGGAGAPFHARDPKLPWAAQVAVFDARQHFVRVVSQADGLQVQAVARSGEIFDEFKVAAPAPPVPAQ